MKARSLESYRLDDYTVELEREEDGSYLATVPQLAGLMATGVDPNSALGTLADVFADWIEDAVAHGESVPEPFNEQDFSGRVLARFPRSIHARLARESERQQASVNALIVSAVSEYLGEQQAMSQVSEQIEELRALIVRAERQTHTQDVWLNRLAASGWKQVWETPAPLGRFEEVTEILTAGELQYSTNQETARSYPRMQVSCG